jgi:hypothetical protein
MQALRAFRLGIAVRRAKAGFLRIAIRGSPCRFAIRTESQRPFEHFSTKSLGAISMHLSCVKHVLSFLFMVIALWLTPNAARASIPAGPDANGNYYGPPYTYQSQGPPPSITNSIGAAEADW